MASTTHVELLDRSPNMRGTLEYVAALNEWNHDKIIDCFDDTLEHRILPASLGRPVRDKALYKEWFSSIFPTFKEFKVMIHELVESGDTIVFHASSLGVTALDTPYQNEYVLFLHFAPPSVAGDLPRICHVKEFVDSQFSAQFFESAATERHAQEDVDSVKV